MGAVEREIDAPQGPSWGQSDPFRGVQLTGAAGAAGAAAGPFVTAGGRAGAVGWLADMLRLDWATPYPRPPLFSRRATRGGIRRFCTSYLIISRLFSFFWRVGSI